MLAVKDNPPVTFPDIRLSEISGTWYVAHTKARFEKTFAWEMMQAKAAYFLPMVERLSISGGRKRKTLMPVFPGYVFFAGDEQTRYRALMTHRLCQVIPAKDQEQLRAELASLQLALNNKAAFDPYPYAVVGRRCRVTSGPFQGVEGSVVQRGGLWKLVLQVSMLGQSVAMEIEPGLTELAG